MNSEQWQLRLAELETRLAFQEDLLEQLDRVVGAQDRSLALLQEQVRRMAEKMSDVEYALEQGGGRTGNEKPPHY
jgi:SlyX protein